MRTEFITQKYLDDHQLLIEETCLWACQFVKVEGGWLCFESQDDYETWEAQE